ncbi:MAG: DUF6318 family protein [Cellulomonas sp.]
MAERRGNRGLVAALLTALALALSACTGTAAPAPLASTTAGTVIPASPTTPPPGPTPSPAPISPPARPAAMDRNDTEGALAAMTYFIALYSYAYASGDLSEWQAMSDPECVFCAGLTTDVQGAVADGSTVVGGELTIISSEASAAPAANIFRVDLTVSQTAYEAVDKSGTITSSGPGTKSASITAALEHDLTWIVRAATTEVKVK